MRRGKDEGKHQNLHTRTGRTVRRWRQWMRRPQRVRLASTSGSPSLTCAHTVTQGVKQVSHTPRTFTITH